MGETGVSSAISLTNGLDADADVDAEEPTLVLDSTSNPTLDLAELFRGSDGRGREGGAEDA